MQTVKLSDEDKNEILSKKKMWYTDILINILTGSIFGSVVGLISFLFGSSFLFPFLLLLSTLVLVSAVIALMDSQVYRSELKSGTKIIVQTNKYSLDINEMTLTLTDFNQKLELKPEHTYMLTDHISPIRVEYTSLTKRILSLTTIDNSQLEGIKNGL